MFEKKSVIATAILAGLASGIALADEATTAPAADQGGTKVEKKNECKGHKNECKGKHVKKGHKDACSGPNGCDGTDMKKDAKSPAAGGAEKKAE